MNGGSPWVPGPAARRTILEAGSVYGANRVLEPRGPAILAATRGKESGHSAESIPPEAPRKLGDP